jgi:transposase
MPARPQLVIWSEEEGFVVAIRFSSAIQSSPAANLVKTPERERERARACPLRAGKSAIRRFLVLVVVFTLLVGESGTATASADQRWTGAVYEVVRSGQAVRGTA